MKMTLLVPLFLAFGVLADAQLSDGSTVFFRICGDCSGNADSESDGYLDPETLATIGVTVTVQMIDGFCAEEVTLVGGIPIEVGACDPAVGCETSVTRSWNELPLGSELVPSFWFEDSDGDRWNRPGGTTPQTDPGSGAGSHTATFGSQFAPCGSTLVFGLEMGDATAIANAVCDPCESDGS